MITPEIENYLRKKSLRPFELSSIEENSREMVASYISKTKECYNLFSKQPEVKIQPNISVVLTNSLSLSAFVSPLEKKDNFLIGFSYGLFANIYACFMGLMSHPNILPFIGNSNNTHCTYDITDYGLLDFTYEHDIVKKNTPVAQGFPLWNYPKDEDRILYALLLSDIALQFVIYHEWGHLLGGHIQFLNTEHNMDEIVEIDEAANVNSLIATKVNGEPIRKAMEFEADYISATMVTSLAEQIQNTHRSYFQAYPSYFFDKYDIRDTVLFSLLSLFHLFQEVRIKKNLFKNINYPSPYYRFCSLIFAIEGTGETPGNDFWKGYNYGGVKDFAFTSRLLNFRFQFLKEVNNMNKTKKNLIKMDDTLSALKNHLNSFRLVN